MLTPLDPKLIQKYDVAGPRYTSYPTAPAWSERFTADDARGRFQAAGRVGADQPLSLYVHLPFCRERCTFCGCNVVVAKDPTRVDRYLEYIAKELHLVAGALGERRTVSQLHWGGGTPTFLDNDQLTRLFRLLTQFFTLTPDAEVAIEIDPRVTRLDQLDTLRGLGFNRISLGVQDVDPEVQEAIGRHQTLAETQRIYRHARALGFSGINFDLIYGLPAQTSETWNQTLEEVVALAPDRLAIYGFAYVPQVKPHQKRLSLYNRVSGEQKLLLIRTAAETLGRAGYAPIGMDHFALATDELAVASRRGTLFRNFQGYTVRPANDTVALGATAISDIAGAYAQNEPALLRYYAALDAGRLPTERGIMLSDDDCRRRQVINSLMCNLSWTMDENDRVYFQPELERLAPMVDDGLVRLEGDRVMVTELGRLFVRNVAMTFDAYLPRQTNQFSRTV